MNPIIEIVDQLQHPVKRYRAAEMISGGRKSRDNRGKALPPEKIDALIWGLQHRSPVVRRCCLELLDLHPDASAMPFIVASLDDPVPRVRWHAVHALLCDTCKAGDSFFTPAVAQRLHQVAERDESVKVRRYATRALAERGALGSNTART